MSVTKERLWKAPLAVPALLFATMLGLACHGATSGSASGGSSSSGGKTGQDDGGRVASGGGGATGGGSAMGDGGSSGGSALTGSGGLTGGATGAGGSGTAAIGGSSTGGTNAAGGSAGSGVVEGGGGSSNPGTAGTTPFKPSYVMGADISWTLEDESRGETYADSVGVKPIEEIMANNGFNFIALRTFVCPSCPGGYSSQGWNDDVHTVTMAKRVKACGMGFLLSFMMADSWSSLGTGGEAAQTPSQWKGMTPAQMQTAAHDYTNKVMNEMVAAGVTPDIVKLGNETNSGMSGIPLSNWTDLSALTAAAMKGIREVDPNIPVFAHNGRPRPDSAGGGGFNAWVDLYLSGKSGTPLGYDGIAGSTYGTTDSGADWTESLSYVINTYDKPVIAVEYTVAPPDDMAGQIINTKVLRSFANHMGWGSFIWEPTRYPAVNTNTLFTHSGSTYTTNAAMTAYPALAKAYGLPVPSGKCVGSQYVN